MQQYKFDINSSFILCYHLNLGLKQGVIQRLYQQICLLKKEQLLLLLYHFFICKNNPPIVITFPCNSLYFSIRSDLLKRISLYKYERPIVMFFLAYFFFFINLQKKNTRKYRKNSICCCFYKKKKTIARYSNSLP